MKAEFLSQIKLISKSGQNGARKKMYVLSRIELVLKLYVRVYCALLVWFDEMVRKLVKTRSVTVLLDGGVSA